MPWTHTGNLARAHYCERTNKKEETEASEEGVRIKDVLALFAVTIVRQETACSVKI